MTKGRILDNPIVHRLLPLLAGAAAFALYRFTAFPGIGGRFHPIDPQLHQHYGLVVGPFNAPWHPLYYSLTWLLQWLPSHLPFADRVTLFSSVFGAASVVLAYLVAHRVAGSRLPALVTALAFAASYSQWVQSTEAEIYTLQMTLTFAIILLLLTWVRSRQPRLLWAAIALYSLSFGVTLSMVLMLPAFLFLVAATEARQLWRPGTLLATAAAALVAMLQYVPCYFLAFQAEPLAWGRNKPADLAAYFYTITGDIFHGTFFAYPFKELLLDRVPLLGWYWHREFLLPGAAALILGLVELQATQRRLLLFFILGWISIFAFCANYGVDDVEVFFLPASAFAVPVMAAGVATLCRRTPARFRAGAAAAYGLLWVGGSIALLLPSLRLHDQPDRPLRRFVDSLEPDAVLVNTNHDWGFTMKVRALLFTEPGRAGLRQRYLEAGPDLGARRRVLADADAVVPRALAANSPTYVLANHTANASLCRPNVVGITLEDLIDQMRDNDRLILAWSGNVNEHLAPPPFRKLDDEARATLRRVGLDGGAEEARFYLGIGCKGPACRPQEAQVAYTPFTLQLDHELSIPGRLSRGLAVKFEGQERDFAMMVSLSVGGNDTLAFESRPVVVGFPRSKAGPPFAHAVVADTQVHTGSIAVVIDGRTGEVRSVVRAHTPSSSLPVFEKIAEYCRVTPESFDDGGTIVMGSAESRPYLGSGFDLDSLFHGRPVAYSTGPRSHVFVPMTAPGPRYWLKLEALLATDDEGLVMEIAVNGRDVYRSSLEKGTLNDLGIDLPAGLIRSGVNQIVLRYSRTKSYFELTGGIVKETGQRAVRLHSLSLIPSDAPRKSTREVATSQRRRPSEGRPHPSEIEPQ